MGKDTQRKNACVHACVRAFVCVGVWVCACVGVWVCVWVCVCVAVCVGGCLCARTPTILRTSDSPGVLGCVYVCVVCVRDIYVCGLCMCVQYV